MVNKPKILIVILGPTAIGKTALSIQLAKILNCEIISADSRQIFIEMNIGTAKPTENELNTIKHHFINEKSINDEYNAGIFENEALERLQNIYSKSNLAIMVGGSGLYVNAVLNGFDDLPKDNLLRQRITENYNNFGLDFLQNQIKKLDIDYYNTFDINNHQRLIRAIEICELTGKTFTELRNNKSKTRNFHPIIIGLSAERQIIYNNINRRVDYMIEEGLIEEALNLHKYKNNNALQTVGYQELFDYFDNNSKLDYAIEKIKQNTRNFAKRQITWFKKTENINWFNCNNDAIDFIISEINLLKIKS